MRGRSRSAIAEIGSFTQHQVLRTNISEMSMSIQGSLRQSKLVSSSVIKRSQSDVDEITSSVSVVLVQIVSIHFDEKFDHPYPSLLPSLKLV